MSSSATLERSDGRRRLRARRPRADRPARLPAPAPEEIPPLSPRLQLVRAVLVMTVAVAGALVLQLVVLSHFQQAADQRRVFEDLRAQLAAGTAPIGATTDGDVVPVGTPVALLEAPSIGLDQVVVEGTTSGALFVGPGHRRDTPLPGQRGTSVVFGRRAAYGAPFAHIAELEPGDRIVATTGQGTFDFEVVGVRREGDPLPPPPADGAARLTLVTAGGSRFVPNGLVRVDAELPADAAVVGERRVIGTSGLPDAEQAMRGDGSTLWALALWLQAALVLSVLAVWSWLRWGRAQTWVVFTPPLLLAGMGAASEVVRLLPNLM